MATEPYLRPFVQVLPLAICISQLTASDLRAYGGMREKTHESAKVGLVRGSSAPKKFITIHIAVRLGKFLTTKATDRELVPQRLQSSSGFRGRILCQSSQSLKSLLLSGRAKASSGHALGTYGR
jgi:hypothetical protein